MSDECKEKLAVHGERIAKLEERVDVHSSALSSRVSIERFSPIEKIVYGIAGIVLVAVMTAIMSVVIAKGPSGAVPPMPAPPTQQIKGGSK